MACCPGPGGFAADRFKISVDSNFLCPICSEVLKDPVQCQNQHYFCKVCIKKHLETNAKSCPICVQDLDEKTLAEPPRILTDYLNGLLICCDHSEKGCTEVVPVSQLKAHVRECKYRPVVCANEKCGQTFNQEDLVDHVNNACEYRLIHCPDCEDDMIYKKYGKHACVLSEDLNKLGLEWSEVKKVLGEMCNSQKEMCQLLKEMSDPNKNLPEPQKEMLKSQTEMCQLLKEVSNSQNDILRSVQSLADFQHKEPALPQPAMLNIGAAVMVIGGKNEEDILSSVEVLYPGSKVWTVLEPMQESRGSAASVLYGNDVLVSGGKSNEGISDALERLSLVSKPLASIPFPVKLPFQCCGHKVAVIGNHLYLVGGYNGEEPCNSIYSILLHPPYIIKLECKMEEPICFHGMQAFEESLFIFGGSISASVKDVVKTVLSYDTVGGELTAMQSLPFEVGDVTTVRWNDNAIVIGGTTNNGHGVSVNTVILYNMKENTLKMLPAMRHARSSCAAAIAGNKLIVMGGYDWCEKKYLNSVECFDLERQVWEEFPVMNEARSEATAVVYAGLL